MRIPFGLPLRSISHLSGGSKDSLQANASATDCQLHTARVEVKCRQLSRSGRAKATSNDAVLTSEAPTHSSGDEVSPPSSLPGAVGPLWRTVLLLFLTE